jgi:acyl dehydratase
VAPDAGSPDATGGSPASSARRPAGRGAIEQRGLYLDELTVGALYAHRPGRTLTEADNVLFTTLTMNTQALHLDAAWSAQQPFGQRLVNSMLTLATLVGQSVSQLTQGTIVAQLGLTDVAFPKPLFHGDTLYTETEITGVRPSSSRPGQGIVTMAHTGRNQHGDVVATATRTVLMLSSAATHGGGS